MSNHCDKIFDSIKWNNQIIKIITVSILYSMNLGPLIAPCLLINPTYMIHHDWYY